MQPRVSLSRYDAIHRPIVAPEQHRLFMMAYSLTNRHGINISPGVISAREKKPALCGLYIVVQHGFK